MTSQLVYDNVKEFHRVFGVPMLTEPGMPDNMADCLLRHHLIAEESSELTLEASKRSIVGVLDALTDIEYVVQGGFLIHGLPCWEQIPNLSTYGQRPLLCSSQAMLRVAAELSKGLELYSDGCSYSYPSRLHAGLMRLLQATWEGFIACGLLGVRLDAHLEVQRSNMSKLGPDGLPVRGPSGRVVKGPNYSPPDLEAVLRRHTEGS